VGAPLLQPHCCAQGRRPAQCPAWLACARSHSLVSMSNKRSNLAVPFRLFPVGGACQILSGRSEGVMNARMPLLLTTNIGGEPPAPHLTRIFPLGGGLPNHACGHVQGTLKIASDGMHGTRRLGPYLRPPIPPWLIVQKCAGCL